MYVTVYIYILNYRYHLHHNTGILHAILFGKPKRALATGPGSLKPSTGWLAKQPRDTSRSSNPERNGSRRRIRSLLSTVCCFLWQRRFFLVLYEFHYVNNIISKHVLLLDYVTVTVIIVTKNISLLGDSSKNITFEDSHVSPGWSESPGAGG